MAAITDKITHVRNGSNPVVTTVASARAIGGTSLSGVNFDGWPTDTAVHFITYQKTATGAIDKTTQCDWKGIVSGTTIGSLTLESGTDADNEVGDFIEMAPTAAFMQDLADGLDSTLNADGTLKDSIVTTPKINDGAVTNAKLSTTTGELGGSWNDYSGISTVTGWSSFTDKEIRYIKIGKTVHFQARIEGTSNATSVSFTLADTTGSMTKYGGVVALAVDNGVVSTQSPRWEINSAASTITAFYKADGTGWTASGTKQIRLSGTFETA